MKKRFLRILAFPILGVIFLVGWILYVLGDAKEQKTKADSRDSAAVIAEKEVI
jgi:hypothetical protein